MNYCVPDWSIEDDYRSLHDLFPSSNQKKCSTAPADDELVELLWRNGHAVVQSQTNRKTPPNYGELKQGHKPGIPVVDTINLIQEDDTAAWFQYSHDDPSQREFPSEFLCGMPIVDFDADKVIKECKAVEDGNASAMAPPKYQISGGNANFSHFSRPVKDNMGSSSIKTVGSGANRSNKIQNLAYGPGRGVKEGNLMTVTMSNKGEVGASTSDVAGTSSGGSACSLGRTTGQRTMSKQTNKRKGRDGEESEFQSKEAEESIEANKSKRPPSTRKSRAAEVHNLSERRRRDRINEKMKALQELIPHCNRVDKASMLDDAIEYLKSLQLQLQLMWMGTGAAQMMFPSVQQYMSQVGIGRGHASMPSVYNPIQLSRTLLANHSANQMPMSSSPTVNPINFNAQMHNVHHSESYFGFPHIQLAPQAMNLYAYESHVAQQNQTEIVAGCSRLPTSNTPPGNFHNGQSG